MPKRVDHEERRRQIANALLRTAATRGLHAAGMREVAAEAGVSLRLVQYYFGTKEELMLFAMQQLAAQFAARAMAQINTIKQTQDPVSPRDVIAAIVTQALPADDERRTFTILNAAYFALSLTDPALAIGPLVKNSNAVADVVASQLRAAQAAGDTPADLDPDLEALSLLAMSAGLGTSILGGQSSPGHAQAVIDYHLDRLFPAPRPALPRRQQPAGRCHGTASASFSATSSRSACRCASSSCRARAITASCSSATFASASASPARAFAAFACGSRLLWLLTLPSIKMLAALLISPTTTVPSFGASPSASAGRRP